MRRKSNQQEFWTLTQVSSLLNEPQHKLIYLCEQGIIEPVTQKGKGRGSSRKFSKRNLFQFFISISLRKLHIPSTITVFVLNLLDEFEEAMSMLSASFKLPESLWHKDQPDIRVVISDGSKLYFTIHQQHKQPKIFGGIELRKTTKNSKFDEEEIIDFEALSKKYPKVDKGDFGYPEGSTLGRTELSLSYLSKELKSIIEQSESS